MSADVVGAVRHGDGFLASGGIAALLFGGDGRSLGHQQSRIFGRKVKRVANGTARKINAVDDFRELANDSYILPCSTTAK